MSKPKQKFILFDFDGVIVDSFDVSYNLNLKVHPEITQDEYKSLFEGNVYDGFKERFGRFGNRSENVDFFFKQYTPQLMLLPVIKGMKETLQELQKKYSLAVISSTIRSPIEKYLKKHKLAHYFCEIMGPEVHKNKHIKIQMLFDTYRFSKDDCVFVTDTLGDMKEASHCDVQSIGVAWGFHGKERLEKGNPFALVETPEELFKSISRFFKNSKV